MFAADTGLAWVDVGTRLRQITEDQPLWLNTKEVFSGILHPRLIHSEIYACNVCPLTFKLKELEKAKEPGPSGRMRKVLVYELRVKKINWW